ncbi:MAG: rRNA pseudouridine synthase [Lachnospiraceae bacterium]|nr:rRNA pseudouridine synthase [Lachnospiraceae bacterium]
MRLDKFLAESGIAGRRKVRALIQSGKVTVNQVIVTEPAMMIRKEDVVEYEGERITYQEKRYYMFHKPSGCVTARSDEVHKTVMDYFREEPKGIFPVGRLDKDTEGLLFLTNDGEFDYAMMNPTKHVEKRYFFWALGQMDEETRKQIETGVEIGDGDLFTKPAKLEITESGDLAMYQEKLKGLTLRPYNQGAYNRKLIGGYLTICEGKKHQVKRMLKAHGCYVLYLKRVAIGDIELDPQLNKGEHRELTAKEIDILMNRNEKQD